MSRMIDADILLDEICRDQCERKYKDCDSTCEIAAYVVNAQTVGGWINNYEWICPTCGSSILIKTSKQSKAIGMKLSVCPVCGKEILYGKAD